MDHDHIKRFSLSEAQPFKSFAMAAQDRPQVKTKDNAQQVVPPPRATFIAHPQLAPPGMMGSRLAADPSKWKKLRQQEAAGERSEFKPFAFNSKEHGHER